MKSSTIITSVILLLFPFVQGLVIIDSILATQCIYYMKDFDWGCNSTKQNMKAYMCRCHNMDWIGSVTNCLESQSNDTGLINHAYKHVRTRCLQKAKVDYSVEYLKSVQQNSLETLKPPIEYDYKHTLTHPIGVNETSFKYYKRSFNHIYAQVIRSQAYQWGYIFFWTFIIIIGTISNFTKHFIINYTNGNKSKLTNNFINKLRYNITVPNLLTKSKYVIFKVFSVHLPTTLQSSVILLFSIYMILASTTGYSIDLPNEYQKTHINQLLDLIGYRTGLGAFALIPPTFFFGIRNNPFIKLTGFSFNTFLTYHKWCARGLVIQALIHSAVWTDYAVREGDYEVWAADDYWRWGIVGTVVLFLMLVQSFNVLREVAYEMFLIIHKTFGILLLLSMWYHCNTLGWMGWIYTCIVIWCYDRVIRFLSILWNGGVKDAKITNLNGDLVRVLIPKPFKSNDYYFPGCFYYVYFLNFKLRFWQSHPFSVMKSMRSDEEDCYVLVFKTHKGITEKIQNFLLEKSQKSSIVNVLIEGPYGHRIPLRNHDQYVFVCAGIGFSPCYSQVIDIIEKGQLKSQQKLIKFIWVVESMEYYNLFEQDMDYLVQNGVELKVVVTNTRSRETTPRYQSLKDELSIEDEKKSEDSLVQLTILNARPKISDLVNETNLNVSTCFSSSGPQGFTDDMRSAVCELIKDSKVRIDFYEESFSM